MISGQYDATVYDQVEALCVIWASGQVNADLQAIEKALQASGSKVKALFSHCLGRIQNSFYTPQCKSFF